MHGSRVSTSVDLKVDRTANLSRGFILLYVRHKLRAGRRVATFIRKARVRFRSPCLLRSVSGTIRHLARTVRSKRRVIICNSCSTSNVADAYVLIRAVRILKNGINCCLPGHFASNCNPGTTTFGGLVRGKTRLVLAYSGKISNRRPVTVTGGVKMSIVISSRRRLPSILPSTCTIVRPGRPTKSCPFPSLSKTNITLGVTTTLLKRVPFRSLSLTTVNAITSLIDLANRGH